MKRLCCCLTVLLCCCIALRGDTPAFEPTSNYTVKQVEGWTVYVNNKLLTTEKELGDKALRLLEVKLYDITRVVEDKALAELRKVPVWMEVKDKKFPCACYHPSRQWLTENGYNPDKAKSVEIANATNFLEWTKQQPSMVIHELAHAYHDRVLGNGNAKVKAIYEQAVKSGRYDSVVHWTGQEKRAYALNNAGEYFAELSEAYFGTNDFYPFVKAELKRHDPDGYKLMEETWGKSYAQ